MISLSLSLFLSLSSSFVLCPHKFDSLCWGLIHVSTTIKATTICFTNTTNLCHCGVQTCLGHMLSPNISFTSSIWKIVLEPDQWYDAMGVWSGSSTISPNGAFLIIYIGLPFPIHVHIIVLISFCDYFVEIALLRNRGFQSFLCDVQTVICHPFYEFTFGRVLCHLSIIQFIKQVVSI